MEYNSSKSALIIPEYGRNVQKLINHAKTIEDDEYRQKFIERIVDLMHQMNPQNKSFEEYKDKLWQHVFKIANYDLKVVPPNGEIPTLENSQGKPSKIEYPPNNKTYRHYGIHIKTLIEKAIALEDEEKKAEFTQIIAAYMKLAYKTWNREHYVSDDIVKGDLAKLSNDQLKVADDMSLDILASPPSNNQYRRKFKNNNQKGKKYSNNKNRNNKYRKKR